MRYNMTIKDYRQAAGLTQQQLAELFDISIDTVKSWDSGRRKPYKSQEKMIIKELERMIENMMEDLLKEELGKREIKIDSEVNFAGNSIRYFIFKGQKIYFDSQSTNGGTYFGWEKEEIENLLFVIDNIPIGKDDGIYLDSPDGVDIYFTWGMRDRLSNVNFSGCWHKVGDKICKKVG